MSEDKKQIRNFTVPFNFNWSYGVSIDQIREDLDKLEKLGVTEIDIETYDDYGDASIIISAISKREETDLEQQERINHLKRFNERNKQRELEQLKKLQEKYKNK